MKGVVKRRPRERSCAGWNSWCYLFCGLIAAFSFPVLYAPCGFYFDFGVIGFCLVLVGFLLFCLGFCLFVYLVVVAVFPERKQLQGFWLVILEN